MTPQDHPGVIRRNRATPTATAVATIIARDRRQTAGFAHCPFVRCRLRSHAFVSIGVGADAAVWASVEFVDGGQLVVGEREVEDVEVLGHALWPR